VTTELGVRELTFSQRKLSVDAEELVAHGSVEKMLMKFRAGAEAIISVAKRGGEADPLHLARLGRMLRVCLVGRRFA
jgi:hypothetical protein